MYVKFQYILRCLLLLCLAASASSASSAPSSDPDSETLYMSFNLTALTYISIISSSVNSGPIYSFYSGLTPPAHM
jgi:hypothetical protein